MNIFSDSKPLDLNDNVNWYALPHDKIWQAINTGPGHAAMVPTTEFYRTAAATVTKTEQQLADGLSRLATSWQGNAAEQAQKVIDRLNQWAGQVTTSLNTAYQASMQQAQHYTEARSSIPPPTQLSAAASGVSGPGASLQVSIDPKPGEVSYANLHNRAAEAMFRYQAQSRDTVASLPEFQSLPGIAVSATPKTSSAPGMVAIALNGHPDPSSTSRIRDSEVRVPHARDAAAVSTQHAAAFPGGRFGVNTTGISAAAGQLVSQLPAVVPAPSAPPPATTAIGTPSTVGGLLAGLTNAAGEQNAATRQERDTLARSSTSGSMLGVEEAALSAPNRAVSAGPLAPVGTGILQPVLPSSSNDNDKEHRRIVTLTGEDVFSCDALVTAAVIGQDGDVS